MNARRDGTHLLGHAASKLPPDACLHRQDDVVHLDLGDAGASGVFCVDLGIRQDLRGVAVCELEELVEDARLGVLNTGGRGEEERDCSGGGRECLRRCLVALQSGHVLVSDNKSCGNYTSYYSIRLKGNNREETVQLKNEVRRDLEYNLKSPLISSINRTSISIQDVFFCTF